MTSYLAMVSSRGLLVAAALCLVACAASEPSPAKAPIQSVELPPSGSGQSPSIQPRAGEAHDPAASGKPTPAECQALLRAGARIHDEGRYDDAIATYRSGLERCGPGHRFLGEIGYSLAAKGQFDAAADAFLEEILAPGAAPTAFGNLADVLPKLSPPKLAAVVKTGATKDAPIHVPDIGGEYFWVAHIACGGAEGTVKSQALINDRGRSLDVLRFTCPDGQEHEAFFDFSADPTEQALMRELRGAP